jgi:hypothetical protein
LVVPGRQEESGGKGRATRHATPDKAFS